ncbi:MAG: YihY family inner membrane protein [Tepidisphaera sp.]
MSPTPDPATTPARPKRKPLTEGASAAFARSISGGLSAIVSKDGPKGSMDIIRLAIHSALQAQLTRMAAALTYRTIFSLIPIIVIGVAILGAFSSEDQVRQSITRILEFSGLAIDAPEPEGAIVDPTLPPTVKGIDQWILELVGRVRGISYSGVAIIGILTLIYGAISMLIEIELAFNQVYHAPAARSWSRRITQYWTLLTLGPVLLFASFAVGERFQAVVSNMSLRTAESTGMQSFLVGFAGYGVTVGISTLMLWVIYVTVPNTKVRMRAAVVGAVSAAILWELGKWGFRAYVASGSVKQLYGALFLLPLFMLWIYVTWMIVLSGLQLSFSLQMFWEVREEGDSFWKRFLNTAPAGPSLVDGGLGVGLPVMIVMARRFREGRPSVASELAAEFALTEPVTLDVLQRLAGAGLVHRIATGDDGDRAFALSRPPEAIRGEEIVTAGDPLWEGAERSPHADLLQAARESRLVGVRGKTLADLTDTPAPRVILSDPAPAPAAVGAPN